MILDGGLVDARLMNRAQHDRSSATASGTATTRARRQVTTRRFGGEARATADALAKSDGATGRVARSAGDQAATSSASSSFLSTPRRVVQFVAEMPRTREAVPASSSNDAKCDHFAFYGEVVGGLSSGEPLDQLLVVTLRYGSDLLTAYGMLRAEVIERDRARNLAEPRARRTAPFVKAMPELQRPFEGLAGEVLGGEAVAREPGEVAVDVVEVPLGRLRESGHAADTPPRGLHVTPIGRGARAT